MSGFYSLLWKPRNSGDVEGSGGNQSQSQKHPLRLLAGRCCSASAHLVCGRAKQALRWSERAGTREYSMKVLIEFMGI